MAAEWNVFVNLQPAGGNSWTSGTRHVKFHGKVNGTKKKKVTVALQQTMKAHRGSRGVTTLSLTSALDGVEVNATPRPSYPRERPGTHYTGGWVGSRAGMYGCGKFRPNGVRLRSAQPVATPTELSRPLQSVGKTEDNADMPRIEYRL